MLSDEDYQEAVRRYKNMKVKGHERQRYHALILIHRVLPVGVVAFQIFRFLVSMR